MEIAGHGALSIVVGAGRLSCAVAESTAATGVEFSRRDDVLDADGDAPDDGTECWW